MGKVCNNLLESPYYFFTDDLTFMFSSDLHRRKFIERYMDNRKEVIERIKARYKLTINANILADIYLYQKIENRGFCLIYKGRCYTCLEQVELSGVRVI